MHCNSVSLLFLHLYTYVFKSKVMFSHSLTICFSEIPVSILKKLEDIRQPEGSAITLECELSRHNVDIKWTKVKLHDNPTPSCCSKLKIPIIFTFII